MRASLLLVILNVLEVASRAKVSEFDSRALAFTAYEDVLVLEIAVHNLLIVNIR